MLDVRIAAKRFVVLTVLCGLILSMVASAASAHTANQSLLYLDISDRALNGRVEYPFPDVQEALGLSLDGDDAEVLAELEASQDEFFAYAASHLSIGASGETWDVTFDGFDLLRETEGGIDFVIAPFAVDVADQTVPRELDVTFDPFFELPNRNALLLIANDWGTGVFDNSTEELVAFNPNNPSQSVDLGDTSQWSNFSASLGLGVDHIRTGPDHILFVLALLLPSVLLYSMGGWHPTDGFTSSLWRILKIVTMFTVAHSITFTLAGLGFLPLPPSRVVESIIALSIAAAALHNLRPVLPNREWMLSFAFGLFHGMGFASLVSDLDASRGTQLVSLLGRNVGIEIGQAVVIILVFPALYLLRRTTFYRPVLKVGSLALAGVSTAWALERIFDLSFGTDTLVERFIRLPRAFMAIAALTVIAAGVRWLAGSRGELVAVRSFKAAKT